MTSRTHTISMSSQVIARMVASMRLEVATLLREVANDEAPRNPMVAERLRDIALVFEHDLPSVPMDALRPAATGGDVP